VKLRIEVLSTVTLVLCALVTTGAVVYREFFAAASGPAHLEQKPHFINDWRIDLVGGIQMGPADASVRLIEFADFECPFCASFRRSLEAVERKYPGQIALTYVYFPIPGHRFALPAARVAECAAAQGRFEEMYDQLFDGQDQFGLKPWNEYATAAAVPDLGAFDACIKRTDPMPRVEEARALGAKLDVQGTPTLIINGWKLGRPPNAEELDGMVKAILAGRSPVTSNGRFAD
jgi:protein-disulfide isomerase